MDEQKWLSCTDPKLMLEFLRGKASERKLRLFAVACCRRIWHLLGNQCGRDAIDAAEKHADGTASDQEFQAIHDAAYEATLHDYLNARNGDNAGILKAAHFAISFATSPSSSFLSRQSAEYSFGGSYLYYIAAAEELPSVGRWEEAWVKGSESERKEQRGLTFEVFGNPFHPVSLDSAWVTSTVLSLAGSIYDERAFDRMPILADALEEAGCTNSDILMHCRGSGPHVRGCWVIDLLLRKE